MLKKQLYTVREALDLIPLSNSGLYRAIQNGDIESHKLGRFRVFTGEAITAFVKNVTAPASKRGAR